MIILEEVLDYFHLQNTEKVVQSMRKTLPVKKEREVWHPVLLDHPEKEVPVFAIFRQVRQLHLEKLKDRERLIISGSQ